MHVMSSVLTPFVSTVHLCKCLNDRWLAKYKLPQKRITEKNLELSYMPQSITSKNTKDRIFVTVLELNDQTLYNTAIKDNTWFIQNWHPFQVNLVYPHCFPLHIVYTLFTTLNPIHLLDLNSKGPCPEQPVLTNPPTAHLDKIPLLCRFW